MRLKLRVRRSVRGLARVALLVWLFFVFPAPAAAETMGGASPALTGSSADDFATATLSFLPESDARVEEAQPSTNFGKATRLGSDGDAGFHIESTLRFQLSGVAAPVKSAQLWLYVVSDGTVDGPSAYNTSNDWTEASVTWDTRPRPTGPAVSALGAAPANGWVSLDVTTLVKGDGPMSVLLQQSGTDGIVFYARQGMYKPVLVVTTDAPALAAAGDIACSPGARTSAIACRQQATADLLNAVSPSAVLALGDEQYETGAYADFLGPGAYDATWGKFNAIIRPVPGNHEYDTAGGAGYYQYFGSAAGDPGRGFYSYDLGAWHLVALNADVPTAVGSVQEQGLRNDLATTAKPCILAYWHEPRFSSGYHGGASWTAPLWNALYAARADVVLNGHDDDYERFAPQDPTGRADATGIREFVVGTGGASHEPMQATVQPNSEVRDGATFGVLKMTLGARGYEWQFVPEAGQSFTDSGSGACHDAPPEPSLAVSPSWGASPLAVTADASGSTDADRTPIASYSFDFGDGSGAVGPRAAATATHIYAEPGTYTVTVTVTDRAGLVRQTSAQIVIHNGGFETGTGGWNTSGSGRGIMLARVSGGHTGSWAAETYNTGALPSTCTLNDSPNWVTTTSGTAYTASLWVRAAAPGATLKLRLREWAGSALMGGATTLATLTTEWQPVAVSYTPVSSGSSTLDLNAYLIAAPPGSCFEADDVAIGVAK